jgi:hypothetical protein
MSDGERDYDDGRDEGEWNRQRELEADESAYRDDDDGLPPIFEPCRATAPNTAPARPGSHNAAAARRAGCEDERENEMQARYGGEW